MQDVRRLQLFVALYDNNDLPHDGGVSRGFLYESHTLGKVSERGAFTIWGFAAKGITTSVGGSPLPTPFLTGKSNEEGHDTGFLDFWAALHAFQLADC